MKAIRAFKHDIAEDDRILPYIFVKLGMPLIIITILVICKMTGTIN